MKRFYLLCIIMALVIAIFSTGYGKDGDRINISISGNVLDLQNQPVKDAKVILKNSIDGDRIVSSNDTGMFSFPKLQVEKDKNISVAVNATGYMDWKDTMKPTGDIILYINLVPMQDNLVLILLLPALLGLIAWVSIKISPKWGKWISVLILLIYSFALSNWILSTRKLISNPLSINEIATWVQTNPVLTAVLAIAAFVVIQFDLILKLFILLGLKKDDDILRRKNLQRSSVNCFAGTSTGLWILTLIGLIYGYILSGNSSIAIFQPDLSVPLLVPIFAFIGVLAYSTANIRESADFSEDSSTSRKKLIVLGERILIGPYIALVAYLVLLGPILKAINIGTSPATAFLAFFTGLYVKQVMDRLDQIGISMLTTESQEKIKLREEEEDELVVSLGLGDTLTQLLKEIKIKSIEDLAGLSDEKINEILKNPSGIGKALIGKAQLCGSYKMACLYKKEIRALKNILSLDDDQIGILKCNQMASIQQLAYSSLDSLIKMPDLGKDEEAIKNLKSKAEAVMKLEDNCKQIDNDTLQRLKNISITTCKQLDELGNLKTDPGAWDVVVKINKYTPKGKDMLKDRVIDVETIFDYSTETTNDKGEKIHDTNTDISISQSTKDKFNENKINKYGDIPLQFIVSYKKPHQEKPLSNNKMVEELFEEIAISDIVEYFGP